VTGAAKMRRRAKPSAPHGWVSIQEQVHQEPAPAPRVAMQLDRGIRNTVERLRKAGVETCESCEGGAGHAYPEPTIVLRGGPGAGWQALSLCLDLKLPVSELRRVWDVLDRNDPTGPYWHLVFKRRPG
jgi:hypothetical protein